MPLKQEPQFSTVNEALSTHSRKQPDKIAFRFLTDGEEEGPVLSYAQLYREAGRIAFTLLKDVNPGDRVVLLYPQGLDFVSALFGCFLAGVIAVPVFPPAGRRRTERLENVLKDSDPVAILATSQIEKSVSRLLSEKNIEKNYLRIITDQQLDESANPTELPTATPDYTALLQYTSGSTGDPKGVEVSHDNLVHNNHALYLASDGQPDTVCWLPVYHDMGLIGNLIYVVYCGGTLTLMSPADFIRKPVRWFRALTKYKASASGSPNFGYDLCTRHISDEDLKDIDLSGLMASVNGAEPIKPRTIRRFKDRFAKAGFREDAFMPCYGMAEATALISGTRGEDADLILDAQALGNKKVVTVREHEPGMTRTVASCGKPATGMRIIAVDPDTGVACPLDTVGEIWVQGRSVAKGYWRRQELTESVFRAVLKEESGRLREEEGFFLRTGDMGFLREGSVYITGRLKEMFVINGANVFPQDIERSIQEDNPVLQENAGAVFAVDSEEGQDDVIVMQEIARSELKDCNPRAEIRKIVDRVLAIHEISLSGVFLLAPGALPKTTSGKIRRLKCAELYLSGQIPGITDHLLLNKRAIKNPFDMSENSLSADAPKVPAFELITEALAYHAEHTPDQTAYRFLEDGETVKATLTYRELYEASRKLAAKIAEHAAPGDRAMLVFPSGLDFPTAFFACLYAGVIAVPMYLPSGKRRLGRFKTVSKDCAPVLAIGESSSSEKAKEWFAETEVLSDLKWIDADRIGEVTPISLPNPEPQHTAFLQYTSGSTGDPKGVEVSHANIVHNNRLSMLSTRTARNYVSWLPIYHDMGLIGKILANVYGGETLTFMAPVDFITKPVRWLRALSEYGGQTSAAPNFAFDHCVKYISDKEMEGVDLSGWKAASNGAEPIKASTIRKFTERFGKYGFQPSTFMPCYGMAETTLIVSGTAGVIEIIRADKKSLLDGKIAEVSASEEEAAELVGSGPVLDGFTVVIADPETKRACPPDSIGEIWVQGPSVTKGYWQRPQLTEEIFRAQIEGEEERGHFLRTGDLGFLRKNNLFVTGRLKELIIINGANIYPQDVERSIQEEDPVLQENAGAVFSVESESGMDEVVVFQEISRQHVRDFNAEEVIDNIIKRVIANHEIPVLAVFLISPGRLPKTTSGKIQRMKCRAEYLAGNPEGVLASRDRSALKSAKDEGKRKASEETPASDSAFRKELSDRIVKEIAELTEVPESAVDVNTSFASLGVSSIQGIQLAERLGRFLGRRVETTDLYNYSTVNELVNHLTAETAESKAEEPDASANDSGAAAGDEPVAVIGISCRFPGADDLSAFEKLISKAEDGITEVPEDRWNWSEYYDPAGGPGKMVTKWGGFISNHDKFDPQFFEISPREAVLMDPQQRILLEETYKLFESSGYPSAQLRGKDVGVFIGIAGSDYTGTVLQHSDERNIYTATGSSYSIAANRLSYFYNFTGPSVSVDTACSSSLVALGQAVKALRDGDCPMAVAGGINLILSPEGTLSFSQSGLMAADGRCKTFDAAADGIVRSDGCGVVLLKPLSAALKDGDRIHAVIRGVGVNQDGRSNGLTAPNGLSQEACIRKALKDAKLDPREVNFVEAHGTGTILGDPIEVNALHAVYGSGRKDPLYVGSVKANIGHTEAAAGIAGFIKAVLAVKNRALPVQANYNAPNPQIDWDNIAVRVLREVKKFNPGGPPLRAGVSSFGFGGTNAHIILESAPEIDEQAEETQNAARSVQILPVSAKDAPTLRRKLTGLDRFLERNSTVPLDNLAFTLFSGRDHFNHRTALIGKNAEDLRKGIADAREGEESLYAFSDLVVKGKKVHAFFFTGAGPQYPGMGKHLYDTEPVFRTHLDRCAEIASEYMEKDLREVIFCTPGSEEHKLLDRIDYMQPAVFAFEYALYKWWEDLGVKADIVIGHSLGELAAACIAGVFDLESAVKLTVKRGELIYKMPVPGTMASVQASEKEVRDVIKDRKDVSVAVLNSKTQTVVSGETEGVDFVVKHFDAEGRKTKVLNISRAGHSPLMDAISDEFRKVAESFEMAPARIPLVSNVTGKTAGDDIATAEYWVNHLRQPVRFADGLQTVSDFGANLLIEVGPNPVLLGISRQAGLPGEGTVHIASASEDDKDGTALYTALAKYYAAGGDINPEAFLAGRPGSFTDAPLYPFTGKRLMVEASARTEASGEATGMPLLGRAMKVAGLYGVFESAVSQETVPYLRDHRIIDSVIAPGSFHIELLLEFAAYAKKDLMIRELSIQRPLFADETATRKVQVIAEEQELSDALKVSVFSTDALGADWTLHVAATMQKRSGESPPSADLRKLSDAHTEAVEVAQFYRDLAEIGFHYGPSFQGVKVLKRGASSVYAELQIAPEGQDAAEAARAQLHPALLDAAFQMLAGLSAGTEQKETYLPFAVENLEVTVPHLTRCKGVLKVHDREPDSEIMRCDITLYTEEGDFAGRLDFSCKKASPEQITAGGSRLRTDWMYDARWSEPTGVAPEEVRPENMLLLCHDDIAADYEGFLMEIKSRGIPHTVVSDWGQANAMMFNTDYDALTVLWGNPEGEGSVAEQSRQWALDGLKMLQDLISTGAAKGPKFLKKIYWVTEGFASGATDLRSAPLWGLGRTFVKETDFDLKLIDIDRKSYSTEHLAETIFSLGTESQVRLTGKKAEVLRLEKHRATEAGQKTFTSRATWIITGGTGDLGLQAARAVATHTDVARIELWARREPSEEVKAFAAEAEALGTSVVVRSVDVADADAVSQAVASVPAEFPVKGVLHIAGVAEDARIPEQNEDTFDKVLNPKIRGAWNLHRATEGADLEAFVLYSSLSALAGVPGVANYAAANTFLDALARYRREHGLAGHSLNWGAWATATGLLDASRADDFRKYMRARGVDLIDGDSGTDILIYSLMTGSLPSQVFVAPLILESATPFELPSGEIQPLYRKLLGGDAAGSEAAAAKSNLRAELFKADPEERHALLASAVKKQVGLVVRHENPEAIDPDADIFSLGVDSLMAAEMVSRLSKMIKEPLAPTILFDQRTVNELTSFLLEVTIDFSAEEQGLTEDPEEDVKADAPREAAAAPQGASVPKEAPTDNGALQREDWERKLKALLAEELKALGKNPDALEESRILRRNIAKLAASLKKRL